MIVYTKQQVLDKLQRFTDQYKFYSDAAEAIGCTDAQLSRTRAGHIPPSPKILAALGIERVKVYASKVEDKYRD